MKRALILTSVASMIDQFNMPFIDLLQEMGFSVDVACNSIEGNTCSDEKIKQLQKTLDEKGVDWFQIDFARNITKIDKNIKAYKQVKKLLEKNHYDFLHCHSPIGGVVGRLAGHKTKTKVIYTAHGFHFYDGAPKKNWIMYYPVEKILSKYTDVLITINNEDYVLARKKMNAKKIVYVPGIGIDIEKFGNVNIDKRQKRKELNIPEEAILLFSVGELNDNKNHETVIKAIQGLDVYYMIAGRGNKAEYLRELAKEVGMEDRVKLLGFRTDISVFYAVSDVFVFPSFREGLSVSLMEAMASGLPCVVSKIRGNTDLISIEGGVLFNPHSVVECKYAISKVLEADSEKVGLYNKEKVKEFSQGVVLKEIERVYKEISNYWF